MPPNTGNSVGETVGVNVGAGVGDTVGDPVGAWLGDTVGGIVGKGVGDIVGDAVGASVATAFEFDPLSTPVPPKVPRTTTKPITPTANMASLGLALWFLTSMVASTNSITEPVLHAFRQVTRYVSPVFPPIFCYEWCS